MAGVEIVRAVVLLTFLFVGASVSAHEMRPAYAEIDATQPEQVAVVFRQPVISGRVPDLALQLACPDVTSPTAAAGADAIVHEWTADCSESGLETISVAGLSSTVIDVIVTYRDRTGERTLVLTPDRTLVRLSGGSAPVLPAYMTLGIQHLLEGLDHVLFVVGLVMLVRGTRRLVVTITSFTVAHSLTLALSVFDVVRLSQGPVEAAIALSLVYIALENTAPDRDRTFAARWPGVIAFAFGLLHGLGFAGVLREIGLPDAQVGAALLLFNIGIEIGQLIVVGALLGAMALWRRYLKGNAGPQLVRFAAVYAIGSVSTYWLIGRVVTLVPVF